ncbi:MAG: hypothetical protein ABIF82_04465 [Planctomycetota bacterium]
MKKQWPVVVLMLLCCATAWAGDAAPAPPPEPEPEEPIEISDVKIAGHIEGENITFVLELTARTPERGRTVKLVTGDIALEKFEGVTGSFRILYAKDTYSVWLARPGEQKIKLTFASRPKKVMEDVWRECSFALPLSDMRTLEVTSDRPDLDINFPKAMRVTREVKDGVLRTAAIVGVGSRFIVRWKPKVQELTGKLVAAAELNSIAIVSAGALRLDAIVIYRISQGEAKEFKVAFPKAVSITQVRGLYIQDWNVVEGNGKKTLTVKLTQRQKQAYALRIEGELPLGELPTDFALPVIEPVGTIRASGHVAVGTDSAVHLKINETGGLTQIDANAFPAAVMDKGAPRSLPARSVFTYGYAATPYQLTITASDMKPSLDVFQRLVAAVRDDDLVLKSTIELDVRDAPIRELKLKVPKGFAVAEVTGNDIIPNGHEAAGPPDAQILNIPFKSPVMSTTGSGRTLVTVQLEVGGSPLGRPQIITGLDVVDAKNERGSVSIVADAGIQVEVTKTEKLHVVHAGSVRMADPRAQKAYRFREPGWSLELSARQNPPAVRCELFHLASVGEGILYGSTTVNFFITGAPVGKLRFRIPKELKNIEFTGRDVQGQKVEGDVWTVTLRRRVVNEYTLLVTSTQPYDPKGGPAIIGGVECLDVDTQVGYIAVASGLNLTLTPEDAKYFAGKNLLVIDRDELPGSYRLLVNAPILRTYKYVKAPHSAKLEIKPYKTGELLGVVIDLMELRTVVSREGEARTTATYHVKNSNTQFLKLKTPEGSRVWSVEIVTESRGKVSRERVITSMAGKDVLLVPLERRRNPNDPIQIVLMYSEAKEDALGLGHGYKLVAPQPEETSTYARWEIVIPEKFEFASVTTDMAGDVPAADLPGLGSVGADIAKAYGLAARDVPAEVIGLCGIIAVVVLVVFAVVRLRWLVPVLMLFLALAWAGFGVAAIWAYRAPAGAQAPAEKEDAPSLAFTQALNPSGSALKIEARIVPAWAAGLLAPRTLRIAGASAALLILAVFRRKRRKLFIALAVGGIFCVVGAVPAARAPLGRVLLIALPFLPLAFVILRSAVPARRVIAAAVILLMLILPLGCTPFAVTPPPAGAVMDRTEFLLKAEKDSMELTQRLVFRTDGAAKIPILWSSAALIASPDDDDVAVKMTEAGATLDVKRPGGHDVTVTFLLPLQKAGADQERAFELAVPKAIQASAKLTIPAVDLDVTSPSAAKLTKGELDKQTIVEAAMGPNDKLSFQWRPRARQTKLEDTVFFSNVLSSARFRAGVVECVHTVHFRIAQGELKDIKIEVPEGMAVTSVFGNDLGTWLYDRSKRLAEVRLSQPAVGQYVLHLITQVTQQKLPYDVKIGVPVVQGADRQLGAIGLYPLSDVRIEVGEHPPKMNVEDYARDVIAMVGRPPWPEFGPPRHAYRYRKGDAAAAVPAVAVAATRVDPEVRSAESALFSVADDRLVYNVPAFDVSITKAGRFSVDLRIPKGYDIDNLTSQHMSHWDEEERDGARVVTVHFLRRLLGTARLQMTLSRNIDELPPTLPVPRVELLGSLKHTGHVVISSDRGVRLSVNERSGVSHIPPELGAPKDALTYKLLRRDWKLVLATERIEPRLEVDFLHIADVSEGLVRGTTHLTYSIKNAGVKVLNIQVPKDLTGLEIFGKGIAQTQEIGEGSGRWQVELKSKEQQFVMSVRYERRFENDAVSIRPVRDLDAELQRGYIVVRTHQKVQVSARDVELPLKPADARSIAGPRDLSDAALCYHTSSADAELRLRASRHEAADILPATVSNVNIETVVTKEGHHISRVSMALRVGSMSLLRTTLPPDSVLWALRVDGRSVPPSVQTGPAAAGGVVQLIPLGRGVMSDVETRVDFIYITFRPQDWEVTQQAYHGPKFDLPLQNIRWTFYLPESLEYGDFDGTLTPDEDTIDEQRIAVYNSDEYINNLRGLNKRNQKSAERWLSKSRALTKEGKQQEARQAANNAYNYSLSEKDTNEDARVALEKLHNDQTVVALAGRRGLLRRSHARGLLEPQADAASGANFTDETVQQVQQQLTLDDNRSMQDIAERMWGQQAAAQKPNWPLDIDIALRGKVIAFERKLQVKPDVDMNVSFSGSKPIVKSNMIDYGWALGIAAAVFAACTFGRRMARPMPEPPPAPPEPPAPETTPDQPDQPDQPDEPEGGSDNHVIEDVPVD